MSRIVTFEIKEDDATGDVGFIPKGCTEFNAATTGDFLFHDVFEHWFENKHPYFSGDGALNPSGEVAAMGARIYNVWTLGFNPNDSPDPYGSISGQCIGDISESSFGEFLSLVPYQRPQRDTCSYVDDIWEHISAELQETSLSGWMKMNDIPQPNHRCIRDCLRWGWRMASRELPSEDWEVRRKNREMCRDFVAFWNTFFKVFRDDLVYFSGRFRQVDIHVKKVRGLVSWKAVFVGYYTYRNVTIRTEGDFDKFEMTKYELGYV